jgi:hypothetical protein
MARVRPLQNNFSGGEISPLMHTKTNTEQYAISVAECTNFTPTPNGTLRRRNGLEYVHDCVNTQVPRIFTFIEALGTDHVVEVGDEFLTVWNRDGQVEVEGGGQNLVTDPEFNNGFTFWEDRTYVKFAQGDDDRFDYHPHTNVLTGVRLGAYANTFFSPPVPPPSIWTFRVQDSDVGQQVTVDSSNIAQQHSLTMRVHTIGNPSDAPQIPNDWIPAQHQSHDLKVQIGSSKGAIDITEEIFPINIVDQNPPSFDIVVNFTPNQEVFWINIHLWSNHLPPMATNQPYYITTTLTNIEILTDAIGVIFQPDSPWTQAQLPDIQTAIDSAKGHMFFVHPEVEPYVLLHERSDLGWGLVPFLGGTYEGVQPDDMGNTWSDQNGWPSTVAIHQGRLYFGGQKINASTLWGTRSGDYTDFLVVTSGATDADPIAIEISTSGSIRWLHDAKELHIGTDIADIIARSIGPITTGTVTFPKQSSWGTVRIQPAEASGYIIFPTPDRRKLMYMFDNGDITNGYKTAEGSLWAEHLTTNIKEIKYASHPNYQMWALRADGDVALSTLNPDAELNAYHTFTFHTPIEWITQAAELSGTAMWCVTNKDGIPRLEVMNSGDDPVFSLDSHVQRDVGPSGLVTGLDHLEAIECQIIVADISSSGTFITIHPSRIVDENGEITLEEWAWNHIVLVGIGYTSTIQTLPIDGTIDIGTALGAQTRWNEVFLAIVNSRMPQINGQRPAERLPSEVMNAAPQSKTQYIKVTNLGYNNGSILIEQDLPLRTEISGIFGTTMSKKI